MVDYKFALVGLLLILASATATQSASNTLPLPANNTCSVAGDVQLGSIPQWNATAGPDSLTLFIGGANNQTNSTGLTNNTRYNFTVALGNGTHYWNTDLLVNDTTHQWSSTNGSHAIRIDALSPTITVTTPSAGGSYEYNAGATTNITAADLECGGYSLCATTYYSNGTQVGLRECDYSSPYSIASAFNNATYHAGSYYINATANDTVGNWQSVQSAFTITPIATAALSEEDVGGVLTNIAVNDLITKGMGRWVWSNYSIADTNATYAIIDSTGSPPDGTNTVAGAYPCGSFTASANYSLTNMSVLGGASPGITPNTIILRTGSCGGAYVTNSQSCGSGVSDYANCTFNGNTTLSSGTTYYWVANRPGYTVQWDIDAAYTSWYCTTLSCAVISFTQQADMTVLTWSNSSSGAIPGASCNATLANGTSFTANATGYANWVEPNDDAANVTATIACGTTTGDYGYQSYALTYATDYWHRPNTHTGTQYTYVTDYASLADDSEEISGGITKCSRVTADISADSGDHVKLLMGNDGTFCGVGSKPMKLWKELTPGVPDTSTAIASCSLTTSAVSGWNSCVATVTGLTIGHSYYVCSQDPDCLLMDGFGAGDGYSNFTGSWGFLSGEVSLTMIANNTFNTTYYELVNTSLYGYIYDYDSHAPLEKQYSVSYANETALCSGTSNALGLYVCYGMDGDYTYTVRVNGGTTHDSHATQLRPNDGPNRLDIYLRGKFTGAQAYAELYTLDGEKHRNEGFQSWDPDAFDQATLVKGGSTAAKADVFILDYAGNPFSGYVAIAGNNITTDCSPVSGSFSSWRLANLSSGSYRLEGLHSAFGWTSALNLYCPTDSDIHFQLYGNGVGQHFEWLFTDLNMVITNAMAWDDGSATNVNASWDVFSLEEGIKVFPDNCTASLLYANYSVFAAEGWANVTADPIYMAFNSTATHPSQLWLNVSCKKSGYEDANEQILISSIHGVRMNTAFCRVEELRDGVLMPVAEHLIGAKVVHKCYLRADNLADLTSVRFDVPGNFDRDRDHLVLSFNALVNGTIHEYASPMFEDNGIAGSWMRYAQIIDDWGVLRNISIPNEVAGGRLVYWDNVREYLTAPTLKRVDASDAVYRGGSYYCEAELSFNGVLSGADGYVLVTFGDGTTQTVPADASGRVQPSISLGGLVARIDWAGVDYNEDADLECNINYRYGDSRTFTVTDVHSSYLNSTSWPWVGPISDIINADDPFGVIIGWLLGIPTWIWNQIARNLDPNNPLKFISWVGLLALAAAVIYVIYSRRQEVERIRVMENG